MSRGTYKTNHIALSNDYIGVSLEKEKQRLGRVIKEVPKVEGVWMKLEKMP